MIIETAQTNMVEQQIRPWNVRSPRLLEVIAELDRAPFVPADQQALCCVDTEITLDGNIKMLEPKVAARLVQTLELEAGDRVLLVGIGSGYTAALCATLSYHVDCIDDQQTALDKAAEKHSALGLRNIDYYLLDAATQALENKEYDAILLRETCLASPQEYFPYLSSNGCCVALVGDGYVMEMMRYRRQGKQILSESIADILKTQYNLPASEKEFVF